MGYCYIYITNESSVAVFFDNLSVRHDRGRIYEENHYYSTGLKITPLSSNAFGSSSNDYLYQGDYADFDIDIGWYDFALRSYDPQIGRFLQNDPFDQFASGYVGMGNDWGNGVDPSGGFFGPGPGLPTPGGFWNGSFLSAMKGGSSLFTGGSRVATIMSLTSSLISLTNILSSSSHKSIYFFKLFQNEEQEKAEVWYYMYREIGGEHAAAYDPTNHTIYEINEPENGNGASNWTFGSGNLDDKPKSSAYAWNMNNRFDFQKFMKRENGNVYLLAPVHLTKPSRARAWFKSHTGKPWDYSLINNNCSDYTIKGLRAGGAQVPYDKPLPSNYPTRAMKIWKMGEQKPRDLFRTSQ